MNRPTLGRFWYTKRVMSKKQKKRNKPYTGEDATTKPTVTRYTAVVRSPLAQWWHDNQKRVKTGSLIGGGAIVFIYLMWEFLNLVF